MIVCDAPGYGPQAYPAVCISPNVDSKTKAW